jgi:ice-binding like protein
MKCKSSILLAGMAFVAFLSGTSAASAASTLGSAGSYAVLAGTAVTCTDSTVTGDVGGNPITQTSCTVNGTVHEGDAAAATAYADFLTAYAALADQPPCTQVSTVLTPASQTFSPGVYCFDSYVALTDVVFTLKGPPNGIWIFRIGTGGDSAPGYLEATNFSVVMAGGGSPCNVYWWVEQYATLTTSNFQGTILAGADITVTGGTFNGAALAGGTGSTAVPNGAVTLTDATNASCEASGGHRAKCNQGVGNGPEGCDPGNSNQGNPANSNDELGGTPGNPGKGPGK